jgi:hypothetical protein
MYAVWRIPVYLRQVQLRHRNIFSLAVYSSIYADCYLRKTGIRVLLYI